MLYTKPYKNQSSGMPGVYLVEHVKDGMYDTHTITTLTPRMYRNQPVHNLKLPDVLVFRDINWERDPNKTK